MANKRLYLDIHAIQVLPPSCVNRDEAGAPKSCLYGGKLRARVSSQCWKHAVRQYFVEHDADMAGVRTKRIMSETANKLVKEYGFSEEDAKKAAENATKLAKVSSEKESAKSTVLFFSKPQLDNFAKVIAEHKEAALAASDKKDDAKGKATKDDVKDFKAELAKAVIENPSADILLFGRFFATNRDYDYDAACQVAHAISVNEVHNEYDYYIAAGDIPDPESTTGGQADYLDTKQFNDPILYRYANVNLSETSELIRVAPENAVETVREFIKAFILSMPTGSQNGYANATLPDYIMLTLRDDMPVSFAPAFIIPVKGDDYMSAAAEKISAYAEKIGKNYGEPVYSAKLGDAPFEKMVNDICEEIARRI